jgi:hypothetical protein
VPYRYSKKNEVSVKKALEYSIGSRTVLWWHCDGPHQSQRGVVAAPYEQTIKQWVARGCICPLCYEEAQLLVKREQRQQKDAEARRKKQALMAAAAAVVGASVGGSTGTAAGTAAGAGAAAP